MALNRSDKSRILRRYFPGMTRNSEMSTEPRYRRSFRSNSAVAISKCWPVAKPYRRPPLKQSVPPTWS